MQQHITDEVLEGYVMETLQESEVEEIETHLLICAACQDRLHDTTAFVQSISAAALEFRQMVRIGTA